MMTMTKGLAVTERTGLIAAGVAMAALLAQGPAFARPRSSVALVQIEPVPELAPAQRAGISLAQATAMAQGRFPGRVLRAQPVQVGDRVIYEIRILGEDGRTVRDFRIDAQTGSFL
jgi:hypothetical protein